MKIGIVGAECSGKSTLSTWLSIELKSRYASVALIPEYLREWSTHHGRPPRAHEQAHVASTQAAHIRQAQAICVVADTTPLVTAVYSDVLFQDSSLYGSAVTFQRSLDLTLLACVDLPWVADGIQRDGVAVQRRIDARLREVLLTHQLPFATVYGLGRTANKQHCKRSTMPMQHIARGCQLAKAPLGPGYVTPAPMQTASIGCSAGLHDHP